MNTSDFNIQNSSNSIKGLIDVISDEMDRIGHKQLTTSKLYLTPNAFNDIEPSIHVDQINKTVYGVTYVILEDLTKIQSPLYRNNFFAIS